MIEADDAMVALLGRPLEDIVGHSFVSFIAPSDVARIAERFARRQRGDAASDHYETTVITAHGARRVIEVHLERRDEDVVVRVLDVTPRAIRQANLLALSALVAQAQRERAPAAVLARTMRGLGELGVLALLFRREGRDKLRCERVEMPAALRAIPSCSRAISQQTVDTTPLTDEAWREGAVWSDDGPTAVAQLFGLDADVTACVAGAGLFSAAVLRVDTHGSPWALLFLQAAWPRAEDLSALRLFAAQLAAVLDGAQAVETLARRNAELASLDSLVSAIGRATSFEDVVAVALREVVTAVRAVSVRLYRLDAQRPEGVLLADQHGVVAPERARVVAIDPAVHAGATRVAAARGGRGPTAEIPLRFRSEPTALLSVRFAPARVITPEDLSLLAAMGAHVVSAIEHHALLRDLRGRVDDLTLLHEVAVASAALDARELLDKSLQRVVETLHADAGFGWLCDDSGDLVLIAQSGEREIPPARIAPGTGLAGSAVARLLTMTLDDAIVLEPQLAGAVDAIAAPLVIGHDRVLGALVLARTSPRPFTPRERELTEGVTAELAIALENARLFDVTRRRAEDVALLYDLSRSITTTLDLAAVLDTGVRTLAASVDAPDAYILLPDETAREMVMRAAVGTHADVEHPRMTLEGASPRSLAARAFLMRETISVEDAFSDSRVDPDARAVYEGRAYIAVPLVARDRAIGAAVIVEPRAPRRFTHAEIERAAAVANQLAIGIANARLYEDLQRSYASLGHAQERLVQRERLAALGELAAIVAHEVRNPLGVLFNSLGSLRRLMKPVGEIAMLVDIMDEEAVRLNRIVGDLLDFARPIAPARAPEVLDRVLDEAVQVALTGPEHAAIRVERPIEPGIQPVPVDAQMLRQAVINLVLNAVAAMPDGGVLRVAARSQHGDDDPRVRGVVIEIEDTGVGIAPDLLERIFEPFFTTRARGSGLGLAVVRRIVEAHRGQVRVVSVQGRGTTFILQLPLADDEPAATHAATVRGATPR